MIHCLNGVEREIRAYSIPIPISITITITRTSTKLEYCIHECAEGGGTGEGEQDAEHQQADDYRQQPPLFFLPQKTEKFGYCSRSGCCFFEIIQLYFLWSELLSKVFIVVNVWFFTIAICIFVEFELERGFAG